MIHYVEREERTYTEQSKYMSIILHHVVKKAISIEIVFVYNLDSKNAKKEREISRDFLFEEQRIIFQFPTIFSVWFKIISHLLCAKITVLMFFCNSCCCCSIASDQKIGQFFAVYHFFAKISKKSIPLVKIFIIGVLKLKCHLLTDKKKTSHIVERKMICENVWKSSHF